MKKRSGRIEIIPYRSDLVEKAREIAKQCNTGGKTVMEIYLPKTDLWV